MAELDVRAMMSDIEKLAQRTAAKVEASMSEEHVGTAADDLVTATAAAGGRTIIDIHVLGKRRLDREELGAAIVEAVHLAEQRAGEAFAALFDDDGLESFSPRGKAMFAERLDTLRKQFPI